MTTRTYEPGSVMAARTQRLVAQQAAAVQAVHQANVAANLIMPDARWSTSCRAYNLHIIPSPGTREALAHVQRQLRRIEPDLLACPPYSLHVSVAWLLAIHVDYDTPKDDLWARYGAAWIDELAAIAAEIPAFTLRYERVVATDSAIIAVASTAHWVSDIRRRIRQQVQLPPQTRNTAALVHTTLCRYGDLLTDPARLLDAVGEARLDVPMMVTELVVAQERVYPSLESVVLARLPLRSP